MRLILSIFSLTLLTNTSCQTSSNQADSDNGGIIFKDSLGHVLSKSDLANITTGQVNYEIMGNQNIDLNANKLHQEARELGQSGKYDLSISKLEQAIKIEPTWAYPFYDLGYTYLLKGDFDNALKFYKKTDELEPKGFFTAKTALHSLEGEKLGKFPRGLYTMYMQIEWTDDVAKKLEIAKTISEKVPDYAPVWKELSMLLDDQTERLNAIEKGLSKQPDLDTKGILTINKALILGNSGKKEEAKRLLGNLIFSPDITTGNLELAKFTLKSFTENPSDK
jgi:tetratricopeptide (TPR) repeat protein